MNYNQAKSRYWKKRLENPLPPLPEDERIYLGVDYRTKDFAKYCRCGFDPDKKLWFTGCLNSNIESLIELYGIHPETSAKARKLLNEVISDERKNKEMD